MAEERDPLRVGICQLAAGDDRATNLARACELLREAAAGGAQVVVLPELFETPYFPATIDDAHFALAQPRDDSDAVRAIAPLCAELSIAVPVSIFERDGARHYNTVVMIDADGEVLGHYRKTHIPDGAGYQEKHYFSAGDTGYRVFETRHGRVGVGICWDQWFPECARALTLQGAELLCYPSAIGSEPERTDVQTCAPWRRVMVGHAVANTVPIAAANRTGDEAGQHFYGSGFICDQWGSVLAELPDGQQGVAVVELDRNAVARDRQWMGLLRDRRPNTYTKLTE